MNEMTQLSRAGLFLAKAPRYTSYPTAPHFDARIGADQFEAWLAELDAKDSISLYLHVPFCRRLCWFCACRTQGTQSDEPVERYLETLLQELDMVAQAIGRRMPVSRVHWGGGTPTILAPAAIERLAGAIFDRFERREDTEFSVEIDPNEIGPQRVRALAAAGMNRASIGVQDFDPMIQDAIGRQQGFEVTRAAADALRDVGISSLNVDLVYGLPHQTPERMSATLSLINAIRPDRIALYGYAHVPWMAKRQVMIHDEDLPDPQARLRLFRLASDTLEAEGYRAIGIDHFALPQDGLARAADTGRLRRNFQGYTDDLAPALIGIGASSISRLPQGYAQNAAATAAYQSAIRGGRLATARGHGMTAQDRVRARAIEMLMCDFALETGALPQAAPALVEEVSRIAADLAAEWPEFVTWDGQRLQITRDGRPMTRLIAQRFDAYGPGKAGHSAAI